MNAPASSRWDHEVRLLALMATCASVVSCLFYFQRGNVMLYGDAIAHINIARRVFDSKTPGLLQLGTVWLPLPHLLMLPFLVSREMWQRGAGGSIPSMAAYVLGAVGFFRLVRGTLSGNGEANPAARVAAWTAALVYGANPNLIYMQTTAMGEALYLAFFIWAVVYFSEFVRGDGNALTKCGLCLAAACWTRYDGWFLAAGMVVGVAGLCFLKEREDRAPGFSIPTSRRAGVKFVLIACAAPVLWLAYNAVVYRNPLEFENGPYSAKAIERKTQNAGSLGHPGSGNLVVAGLYFLKAGEANVAVNQWLQRLWVVMVVLAFVVAIGNPHPAHNARAPGRDGAAAYLPLVFLLLPVPFYALSVAHGGVPIFIPAWWPFSHYNVRYGLQLLPTFAAAVGMLVDFAMRSDQWPARWRQVALAGVFAVVVVSYISIWRENPVCLSEAVINMRTRNQLEKQLAEWLRLLPPESTLLMYLGDHGGAVQQAGMPLKRVINEGNHRVWKQPDDPEGLWERTLANPAKYADYGLAFEGDRVWQAVESRHPKALVEIHVTGQARAILYRLR